jgi:hypothetical protein
VYSWTDDGPAPDASIRLGFDVTDTGTNWPAREEVDTVAVAR